MPGFHRWQLSVPFVNQRTIIFNPAQIKQLWTKVSELLGDEPTPLEREALAIEAPKEA